MTKFPVLSTKQVIKTLKSIGFEDAPKRGKGSHAALVKREEGKVRLVKFTIKIIRRYSMMITVRSKIENGSIRLPKKVRLQDGTRVIVRIEPILKTKEKLKIITELSGAWSNDPTIMPIFEELEQERHRNIGREVSFE